VTAAQLAAAAAAAQRFAAVAAAAAERGRRARAAGSPTWVHAVSTGHRLCVRNQLVALQTQLNVNAAQGQTSTQLGVLNHSNGGGNGCATGLDPQRAAKSNTKRLRLRTSRACAAPRHQSAHLWEDADQSIITHVVPVLQCPQGCTGTGTATQTAVQTMSAMGSWVGEQRCRIQQASG
jgi:hypothetical protein